jgi:hypothetical protein
MITQEYKNHILAFLPVMIELEAMGWNPVKVAFCGELKMDEIEAVYVALNRAGKKYPKWKNVISAWMAKRMRNINGNDIS